MLIKRRVRRLAILLICLFLVPVGQLWYYQVAIAGKLLQRPENTRDQEDLSLRGRLLDRRGQPLAYTQKGKRVYPLGSAAAPLIGYLTDRLGGAGLEEALSQQTTGRRRPRTLEEAMRLHREGDRKGDDIVLTLDSELQKAAYALLEGQRGAIVLLHVPTGEVLAAASRPSFDPAAVEKDWDKLRVDKAAPLIDRATQGLYPPGSSFKVLTMAAVLAEGKATAQEVFQCSGGYTVSGFTLYDDGGAAHGALDLTTALARSCNVTFGQLGTRLGIPGVKSWMERFGMLQSPPLVPLAAACHPPRSRGAEEVGAAQAGIGQADMLVSPLAMARLAATIGRGGEDIAPRLLRARTRRGQMVHNFTQPAPESVLHPAQAGAVLDAMVAVVQRGTGGGAALAQVQVAGKTGTAENPHGRPHAWFVGLAPAEQPRFAVAVVLENRGYGGEFAAPVAARMLEAALSSAIPPGE